MFRILAGVTGQPVSECGETRGNKMDFDRPLNLPISSRFEDTNFYVVFFGCIVTLVGMYHKCCDQCLS